LRIRYINPTIRLKVRRVVKTAAATRERFHAAASTALAHHQKNRDPQSESNIVIYKPKTTKDQSS
jgi:hypothetical protein